MQYYVYINEKNWNKDGLDCLRKLKQDYTNVTVLGDLNKDIQDKIKSLGYNFSSLIKTYNDDRDIIKTIAENVSGEGTFVFMDYSNPIKPENDEICCSESEINSLDVVSGIFNLNNRVKYLKYIEKLDKYTKLSFLSLKGQQWKELGEFQNFINSLNILDESCGSTFILNFYLFSLIDNGFNVIYFKTKV